MEKLIREKQTVEFMIALYCKKKHGTEILCSSCKILADYASDRLEKCPFGNDKPACKECKVHCYKPLMRDKIRVVMRYAGPRMFIYYPIAYLRHKMKKSL